MHAAASAHMPIPLHEYVCYPPCAAAILPDWRVRFLHCFTELYCVHISSAPLLHKSHECSCAVLPCSSAVQGTTATSFQHTGCNGRWLSSGASMHAFQRENLQFF